MKKSLLLILSALLLIMTLVSCGSTGNGNDDETTINPLGNSVKTEKPKGNETDTTALVTKHEQTQLSKKPEEYTYSFKFDAPVGNPRDIVYDYMYKMATVEWVPTKTWTTKWKPGEEGDYKVDLTYEAGKTYRGVMYSEAAGAFDMFDLFLEDGKFTPNSEYHREIVGNHCSSSMVMAYQQILDFTYQGSLKPTVARTGLLKFPDGLEVPPPRDGNNPDNWISANMFSHNGKDAVIAGYAQLDKGDILYKNIDGSGHTRMVHKVEVFKTAAGKVIPNRSYVYCLEQTNSFSFNPNKDSTWWVDSKYSFSELYDTLFMPVTLEIFHEENPKYEDAYIVMEGKNSADNIMKTLNGSIESNFPLNYVYVTIKDADGNVVAKNMKYAFNKTYKVNLRSIHYELGLDNLPSGTYTYNLRAAIARGGVDIETFQFTK